MNVLHIGKFFPPFSGGIENYMAALFPALEKTGVKSCGVVHHHDPRVRKTMVEMVGNSQIYRAPCHGSLVFAPVSPAFPFVLDKAIQEFKPDIVHIHMPNTSAFWALFHGASRRIPWVVQWHADVVESRIDRRLALAYPFYRPFEQRLLGRASCIMATSLPYRDTSPSLEPWRHKTRVVPLGIPDRNLTAAAPESFPWNPGSFRILCVGRLTYYKGHEILIRAAAGIDGIHLVIVGKGELEPDLRRLITDLGVGDRVSLAGHASESALETMMAGCDLFVLPSIERTEAFGLVILEAMRAGKPVIASRVNGSGMGWVVQDGKTGFLVPPGSVSGLTRAIRNLAASKGLCRSMGAAGRQRFLERFSIEQTSLKVCRIYREVLFRSL